MDRTYSLHCDTDEAWVSSTTRQCVQCDAIKDLHAFRDTDAPKNRLMVMAYCKKCLREERYFQLQESIAKSKEIEATARHAAAKAGAQLASVLKSPKHMGVICPDPIEGMRYFTERRGGVKPTFELMSDSLDNAIAYGDPKTQVQAVSVMGRFFMEAKKLDNEKPDLSQFDHDELMEVLEEPAKLLLMTDDVFLGALLSDEKIRQRVLDHLGIMTIDQEQESDIQHIECEPHIDLSSEEHEDEP